MQGTAHKMQGNKMQGNKMQGNKMQGTAHKRRVGHVWSVQRKVGGESAG